MYYISLIAWCIQIPLSKNKLNVSNCIWPKSYLFWDWDASCKQYFRSNTAWSFWCKLSDKKDASNSVALKLWHVWTNFTGLCGNFNNIQADDFTTISGLREATAVDFANTWKTRASCPDVQRSFENPCSLSSENGTVCLQQGSSQVKITLQINLYTTSWGWPMC